MGLTEELRLQCPLLAEADPGIYPEGVCRQWGLWDLIHREKTIIMLLIIKAVFSGFNIFFNTETAIDIWNVVLLGVMNERENIMWHQQCSIYFSAGYTVQGHYGVVLSKETSCSFCAKKTPKNKLFSENTRWRQVHYFCCHTSGTCNR